MNATIRNITITAISLLTITAYADAPGATATAPAPAPAPAATPAPAAASSIAGNYKCDRFDAAGNKVFSNNPLTVTSTGSTYTFEWDNGANPVLYGTGVIHPDMKNMVTLTFWDPKVADTYGLEMFDVNADGSLSSHWVLHGSSDVGKETCTKA